jgi:NADH-quinone oxidoreductase subunit G
MTQRGQGDDRIKRIVPRANIEVNGYWICDEGRLSYEALEAAPRLKSAQLPAGQDAEWDDAVQRAADLLKSAADKGRAAAIVSPRTTCESMHAWKRFLDSLSQVKIGVQAITRGENDEILIRADKGANSTGAKWIFGEQASGQEVIEAASRGEIDTLLVLGDLLDPEDTVELEAAVREKIQDLIYVGPFADATAEGAAVVLPTAAWSEEDGSYVNFEGRVQLVRRCHLPRGEGRPGWRVAADLVVALGQAPPAWTSSDEVLVALAKSSAPFEGLSEESIGAMGVRGAAERAGA